MIVISDTNILSSFAAGQGLPLLLRLFAQSEIYIPPAVLAETQVAISFGRDYLIALLEAIENKQITVLPLTPKEMTLLSVLPHRLNAGEREAVILAQQRQGTLLSNDQRATRYCNQQGIRSLDLVDILRLLWILQIISRHEVQALIERMEQVEQLILTAEQRAIIFAPRQRVRRK